MATVYSAGSVEYNAGRGAQEELRFVGAFEPTGAAASAGPMPLRSTEMKPSHGVRRRVQARWFACEADAAAAIAEYAGRGPGRRGALRAHGGIMRSAIIAWQETRRTRRPRRGRPAKTDPPPTESGYRLVVEVEALSNLAEDNGWTVLATTVHSEVSDADILQAYQDQNTPVEPGFRWIKKPGGDWPGVAGETRTHCRLGNADGNRLAGLQRDPATGPSVPTHA